jgi:prepilin-type N-terminal cleavage/methylation domain-containing protein
MKLNKKGFTLIELLAVVVIMLAISVMAVSSISASIKRNNKKQDETKKKVLISYGELYYQKYKNRLSSSPCISIDTLANEFNLSEDELTDSSDVRFSGCIRYSGGNFEYED